MITWCDISIVLNVIILKDSNLEEFKNTSNKLDIFKHFKYFLGDNYAICYRFSIVDY